MKTSVRKTRCAIYTRVSTDERLDMEFNSLDAQREAGAAYVESQKHEGWIPVGDRYDDGGFSGGTLERPALLKLAVVMPENMYTLPLAQMSSIGININLVLMVLNLLPLPPLDGGRIAVSLLPHRLAWKFAQLERWGFPILLLLLFTGILGAVMNPLVILSARAIESIFGLY